MILKRKKLYDTTMKYCFFWFITSSTNLVRKFYHYNYNIDVCLNDHDFLTTSHYHILILGYSYWNDFFISKGQLLDIKKKY